MSPTPLDRPKETRGVAPTRLGRLLLLACVLPLLPLLFFSVVPGSDYMMHIARAAVLAYPESLLFRDVYRSGYVILPNLAVDVIVPLFAKIVPLSVAGRLYVALCFVLQTTGALALMWATQRRLTAAALIVPLLCYNYVTGWGFLSYMLGMGLAVWALALSLLLENRPFLLRLAVMIAFATMIYFCHLAAFGLMVASIGIYQGVRFSMDRNDRRRSLLSVGLLIASLVPIIVLHVKFSLIGKSVGTTIGDRLGGLTTTLSLLNPYNNPFGFLLSAAFIATLAFLIAKRWLRIDPILGWVALALYIIYFFTPIELFGSFYASTRMLPFAALVFVASLRTESVSPRHGAVVSGLAMGLLGLQTVFVLATWHRLNRYEIPMVQGIRKGALGSMVVAISFNPLGKPTNGRLGNLRRLLEKNWYNPEWDPNIEHLTDQAQLLGDYFAVQNYLLPGKQPVNIDPRYRDIFLRVNGATPDRLELANEAVYERATPTQRAQIYRRLNFQPINVRRHGAALGRLLISIDERYRSLRRETNVYPKAGTIVVYFHRGHPQNPYPGILRELSHDEGMVNVYEVVPQ